MSTSGTSFIAIILSWDLMGGRLTIGLLALGLSRHHNNALPWKVLRGVVLFLLFGVAFA